MASREWNKAKAVAVRDTIRAMKEGRGACQACAKPYDPERPVDFHWDHTYPERKRKIPGYHGGLFSVGMRYGIPAMIKEIVQECEMLCVECHKWKTKFDRLVRLVRHAA